MNETQKRHRTRAQILHNSTHVLLSVHDFAFEPEGLSTKGIRSTVRQSADWILSSTGVGVFDVREELLLADAVDRGDRPALAAQLRRIAGKVHALALEAAGELERGEAA